jgi:hypothetical protein
MLHDFPHVLHFKCVANFGEGQLAMLALFIGAHVHLKRFETDGPAHRVSFEHRLSDLPSANVLESTTRAYELLQRGRLNHLQSIPWTDT